jgi:flagellar biogenesis protein FliO
MLASLLLSALAVAPQIQAATEGWDGHKLEVAVVLDGPVAAQSVLTERTDRALRLTIPGASLEGDAKTFGEAVSLIRARRTARGVTLEAPIGRRLSCTGDATVTVAGSGVIATLACALRSEADSQKSSLKAALALPEDPPEAKVENNDNLPRPEPRPEPKAAALAAEILQPSPPAALLKSPDPAPLMGELATEQSHGLAAPLAAIAIIGLGITLALRKRGKSNKMVQVLETANLGPKRSLVVTRIGKQTMLLASSEAGISLLATVSESERSAPITVPAEQKSESTSTQASLLEKLLGHHAPHSAFAELLADTAEDQDLRRKLEAGVAGRVS